MLPEIAGFKEIEANGKKNANGKNTSSFNIKHRDAKTMGISTVSGIEVGSNTDGKIVQNKREDELRDIGSIALDGLPGLLNFTEHMKGRDTDQFSHNTNSEFSVHRNSASEKVLVPGCYELQAGTFTGEESLWPRRGTEMYLSSLDGGERKSGDREAQTPIFVRKAQTSWRFQN
ncbi:hypothetical protein SUGI_0201350 [Cryptomeria japonica]|nr:hypothetical protein SUGI_0201350 [Cryptomeria japonica]